MNLKMGTYEKKKIADLPKGNKAALLLAIAEGLAGWLAGWLAGGLAGRLAALLAG